jgi:hypothetical protein
MIFVLGTKLNSAELRVIKRYNVLLIPLATRERTHHHIWFTSVRDGIRQRRVESLMG